jgi:serine/threonine protein kinase
VIVQDVLNALVVLHDSPLNLHHNDIKPTNIIVASVSKTKKIMSVKLIDFERAGNRNNERVEIEGTVGYLSPEEIFCYTSDMCYANYDEAVTKSDIWAFGVTLYRLIFLHEPFMFQEDLEKVSKQVIKKYWKDYVRMRERILKSEYLRTDFQEFLLGLLQWDYKARLSAAQARQHPYFIRSMYEHKRLIEQQQQQQQHKKKSLLGSCFNCF